MFSALRQYRVVPILKAKSLEVSDALSVADALVRAGLPVLEIMFRRFSDSKAIKAISSAHPDFWIGAGDIVSHDQLIRAIDSKAKFAVAPGVNPETIKEAAKRNIMFAPGASTPSDIENILLNSSVDFQFFPAEQTGGVEKLKAILEPFDHLTIDVLVKGGVTREKIAEYLKVPQVAAVSVDWIVTQDRIERKAWDEIFAVAQEALRIAKEVQVKA